MFKALAREYENKSFEVYGLYETNPTKDDFLKYNIMRLIILPLTQRDKTLKQELIEKVVNLAKQVQNEQKQLFALAGILTATNKFINRNNSENIRKWISMTHLARLYEEEKIEALIAAEAEHKKALNAAVEAERKKTLNAAEAEHKKTLNATVFEEKKQIAKTLLSAGLDILEIMRATKLSRAEVEMA